MTLPIHTCFEPLLAPDVTERPLAAVVGSEWRDAVVNGVEAAVLVLAVLLWQGTPLWLVAGATAGAVLLGTLLHQLVLVGAVLGLRAWRGPAGSRS
jgi:hypothetical protein